MPSFWDLLPSGLPRLDQALGMPSWWDQAQAQSQRNQQIMAQGGSVRDLVQNPQDTTQDLAGGFGGGILGRIKAYHGSPYDFERFDMSKIGTGEGAQAYGHGLYFAEHEPVAQNYRDALAGSHMEINGKPFHPLAGSPEDVALAHLEDSAARGHADPYPSAMTDLLNKAERPYAQPQVKDAIDILKKWNESGAKLGSKGKMYEVNINADPEHFLPWDTKVRDMPPAVQEKLKAAGWNVEGPDQGLLGQQIYQRTPSKRYAVEVDPTSRYSQFGPSDAKTFEEAVAQVGGDKSKVREIRDSSSQGAMNALREAGIPGIKYLDQGSRRAIELQKIIDQSISPDRVRLAKEELAQLKPTSNYVVFDDKLIDIVKKYGLAGLSLLGIGADQLKPPPAQAPIGLDNGT